MAHASLEVGKRLYRRYSTDAVSGSAAAVSYYFLFSFFPFLLFVTALIAYLPLETPVEAFLGRRSAWTRCSSWSPARRPT